MPTNGQYSPPGENFIVAAFLILNGLLGFGLLKWLHL